ncbi:transposase, partial [mine drainage metagenome]
MVLPADINTEEYIRELESTVNRLTTEILSLRSEIENLKRRLIVYENPHTPPSKQMLKKREDGNAVPKKRGAPLGHKGATRIHGEPDEVIHVSEDQCPKCQYDLGKPICMEKKTIIDIPPPQKIKVTEYDLDVYRCGNCGAEVKAKHRDCPTTGDLGIYFLNYITMLKYNLRGPMRR